MEAAKRARRRVCSGLSGAASGGGEVLDGVVWSSMSRRGLFAAGAEAVDFPGDAFAAAECFEAFDLIFGKYGIDAFFDVGEFTALSEGYEGDSATLLIGGEATSASDAVNIVIAVLGNVIVNNV